MTKFTSVALVALTIAALGTPAYAATAATAAASAVAPNTAEHAISRDPTRHGHGHKHHGAPAKAEKAGQTDKVGSDAPAAKAPTTTNQPAAASAPRTK